MGTNLFVEGFPSPVVLRVTLRREARTFREIAHVASGLRDIDTILKSSWSRMGPSYERRRNRDVLVLHFHVDSPVSFEILSDPAWLAVFLIILTGYKQGKESAREMAGDLSWIASGIKGLTARQLELLEISVRLGLDRLFSQGERESIKIAKMLARARLRLTGEGAGNPEIVVRDVDNKYQSW